LLWSKPHSHILKNFNFILNEMLLFFYVKIAKFNFKVWKLNFLIVIITFNTVSFHP